MSLGLLCVLWISWCVKHSILIDTAFPGMVKKRAPWTTRYYRLFYNWVSLVTLIPLMIITRLAEGPVVVGWEGNSLVRILSTTNLRSCLYPECVPGSRVHPGGEKNS